VEKSTRRLSLFRDSNQIKIYQIALGRNPLGAKQEEATRQRQKAFTGSMAEIRLKLLERASRFFDIRWPQNNQTFFRFATGGQIGVFNIHLSFGESLGDFT
jgi:hypothetical protein